VRDGGLLLVLRAAAVLIIATGVNDVIAGAVPQYEPLYVYLGAVALIVWLDGVILGTAAAACATAFYALLFMAPAARLSSPVFVPLGASLGVVAITGSGRALVRSRRRERVQVFPVAPAPQLLTPPPPPPADMTEVLDAIDELREEIRDEIRSAVSHDDGALRRALDASRMAHDLERTRAEGESKLRQSLALDLDVAHRRADSAIAEAKSYAERAAQIEQRLEAALLRAETAVASQEELQQALQAERARHERSVAADEEAKRSLANQIADLEQILETQTLESDKTIAAHSDAQRSLGARIAELEQLLARERGQVETERAHAVAMTAKLAELEQRVKTERERAAAAVAEREEMQRAQQARIATLEQLAATVAARENAQRALQVRVAELEQRLAVTTVERDENERTGTARFAELERALTAERANAAATQQALEAKLMELAEHLTFDHEMELGKVAEEREAMSAQVRDLSTRLASAQRDLEKQRDAAAAEVRDLTTQLASLRHALAEQREAMAAAQSAFDAKLQEVAEHLASDHEADLGRAVEEREAARAEVRELTMRLASAQQDLSEQREALTAAGRAFDVKLQEVAEKLASDHEADLAKAVEERAVARTEVRDLTMRLASAQHDLAEQREALAAAQRAFDVKLQEVAEHLASDHEADLGRAVEEREVARAEVRELGVRLASAQRDLAEQREAAAAAQLEFDAKLQTVVEHLASDHEADLGKAVEEREAAKAEGRSAAARLGVAQQELDRLRSRLEELERGAAPASGKTRILVAHPDPDMRASARASLERAGYEIVVAADGLEALRTAIAARPAIVIADAIMPKMNGRELCQLLKSQEKTAHIRVILLTRATDDPPKGELPPDEVLRKPVPLEVLKATLAQMVSGK
jgi:CheY-like chemotaxis protein